MRPQAAAVFCWINPAAEGASSLPQAAGDGIILPSTTDGGGGVEFLCKLRTDYLEKEFGRLNTDEVVLTAERDAHIRNRNRHPLDYALFERYRIQTITKPDIVLRDSKNEDTIFMIRRLEETNLNVVLRLSVSEADMGRKNSIMTFFRIRRKNLEKLIAKHKTLYKRE